MSNVPSVAITHVFNGDASAQNYVDAAQLDTQLGNLASSQNLTKGALDRITNSDNSLAYQTVGFTQLKPEIRNQLLALYGSSYAAAAKTAVRLVSVTNVVVLSGNVSIDGVLTSPGDYVLLTGQTTTSQNGIWVTAAGAWARRSDLPAGAVQGNGWYVIVYNGGTYAGTAWGVYSPGTNIVGTDPLLFIVISGIIASQAMQAVLSQPTLALARAAMGPWSDAVATAAGGVTSRSLANHFGDFLSVKDFGAVGDGVTDDTAAFNLALASGKPIWVPPGVYIVNNVTVPLGAQIVGSTVRGYGITFSSQSILQRAAGATRIFNGTGKATYRDLTFNGVDRTATGIGGVTCGTVLNCYFLLCDAGIGDGGAQYPSTMVDQSEFYGGNYGVRNVRDSRVINCSFAANKLNAIDLQTGASDNIITNNKIEFNEGNGCTVFQSNHIVISCNLFDRNYVNGLVMSSADSNVICGNYFRRNGRNNSGTTGNDSHISINGSNNLTIVGNSTVIGQDDGGTGTFTPKYCVTFVNACSNILMMSNDFSGFIVSAFNYSTKPSPLTQRSNVGVTSEEIGSFFNASAGRQYLAFNAAPVSIAPLGAGATILTVTAPAVNTFTRQARRMLVYLRNSTTGSTRAAEFTIAIVREGGSASISASTVYGEIGAAGSIGVGAGTVLNLAFASIAADGSSYSITGTNPSATDTIQITVEIQ